mmetsp:Transcript_46091/g.128139  ORF Transcript_46091/g.128139 Transcript_46091/m.128139 type:complete len:227 (-) Transcript_46091:89-769(-)
MVACTRGRSRRERLPCPHDSCGSGNGAAAVRRHFGAIARARGGCRRVSGAVAARGIATAVPRWLADIGLGVAGIQRLVAGLRKLQGFASAKRGGARSSVVLFRRCRVHHGHSVGEPRGRAEDPRPSGHWDASDRELAAPRTLLASVHTRPGATPAVLRHRRHPRVWRIRGYYAPCKKTITVSRRIRMPHLLRGRGRHGTEVLPAGDHFFRHQLQPGETPPPEGECA